MHKKKLRLFIATAINMVIVAMSVLKQVVQKQGLVR